VSDFFVIITDCELEVFLILLMFSLSFVSMRQMKLAADQLSSARYSSGTVDSIIRSIEVGPGECTAPVSET